MRKQPLVITSLISLLLMLAVLSLLVAWGGFAIAQNTTTETGEGPVQVAASSSPSLAAAPAGAIAQNDNPTGDGQAASATQAAPAASGIAAGPAGLSHWAILGSHLQPRSSGLQFAYGSNGCIYVTNAGGEIRMQFPVTLPDGSIVKSMDIIYQDTSASALTVWLTSYAPGTSSADIVSVSSTNSVGTGSSSSSEITHMIDNSANVYSLNYSWGSDTTSALQICGIRINYIDPFYTSFLPSIQKN